MNADSQSLPYAEIAEKGVLADLMRRAHRALDPQIFPELFWSPANRVILGVVVDLASNVSEISFEMLVLELTKIKQLEEVGGRPYLNELWTHDFPGIYYFEHVLDAWRRRSTILECRRREAAAFDRSAPESSFDPDGIFASNGNSLKGASFLDFSKRQIDESKTLLGNRYLCRGGGLFIVAPSGIGKSVLAAQAAIECAIGRRSFGIRPARPLKSFIIQAEDDEGDIIEMAQIVDHLELNSEQRKLVASNTHIEFVNDVTSNDFLRLCDSFLLRRGATDLLWINPYTAYLGADIKDDGENTRFLRNGLNPILTKHECAAVVLHHTPKTNFRDTSTWKPSDWMYSGAGAAVLTNWARAYLAIDPCGDPGVYKFIAAKRGKRIGWGDRFPVFEQFWAHSTQEGQLLWLPANEGQLASAKSETKATPEHLLRLIPMLEPLLQEKLFQIASSKGISEKKARQFIKILIDEQKIYLHKIPRPSAKSAIGYAQTAQTEEE
jgi:hypothetical protein